MLDGSEKDYVVYRVNRTGDVFNCHKGLYAEWEKQGRTQGEITMLVNNVTQKEAWRFCQLTKES